MMLELVVVEVWSRVVVVEAALDEVDGWTVTFTVVVPTLDPGQSVFNSWPSKVNPSNDCIEFEVMIWKLANDKADVVEASASSLAAIGGPLGDLPRDENSHIADPNDFVLGWC
ncbi:hypothetical protein SCUP515_03295 [Seiridium cupressi]